MNTLKLTTSVPPSTNNAYSNGTKGRHLTPRGRRYKDEAGWAALAAGAKQIAFGPPFRLTITLFFPDSRRRDVSQYEKLAVDSLFEVLGYDDSLIDDNRQIRGGVDPKNPRAEITLEGCGS